MKKPLSLLIIIILLFSFTFGLNLTAKKVKYVESQRVLNKKTIVLDAGHGGKDSGTSASDGTLEKSINLGIVLNLYDFIRFSGINAVNIRNNDSECYPPKSDTSRSDLYNRLDFVNSVSNSVLVSIHQNHFEDPSEWGMQVWYAPNAESSDVLADNILNITKEFLQPENKRENKPSDSSYYILYQATAPSVMVECGFMSNTEENNKLKNDSYQKQLSYTILMGINKYLSGE